MIEDLMDKAGELVSVELPRTPRKPQLQIEYPATASLSPKKSKRSMTNQSTVSRRLRKLKPTSDVKKDFFAQYTHRST
eukprot:652872-Ditylum_brightwellii.AAC.1